MNDAQVCSHLDTIEVTEVPDNVPGCEECLKTGGRWVHLRMCQSCGHIGCCDQSPGRHATGHFHETRHPIIRSAQPDEDWSWCYVDEVGFVLRGGGGGGSEVPPIDGFIARPDQLHVLLRHESVA